MVTRMRSRAAISCSGKVTSDFTTAKASCLHANAYHMAVAEEPLLTAIKRIRDSGSEVLEVRRPR